MMAWRERIAAQIESCMATLKENHICTRTRVEKNQKLILIKIFAVPPTQNYLFIFLLRRRRRSCLSLCAFYVRVNALDKLRQVPARFMTVVFFIADPS